MFHGSNISNVTDPGVTTYWFQWLIWFHVQTQVCLLLQYSHDAEQHDKNHMKACCDWSHACFRHTIVSGGRCVHLLHQGLGPDLPTRTLSCRLIANTVKLCWSRRFPSKTSHEPQINSSITIKRNVASSRASSSHGQKPQKNCFSLIIWINEADLDHILGSQMILVPLPNTTETVGTPQKSRTKLPFPVREELWSPYRSGHRITGFWAICFLFTFIFLLYPPWDQFSLIIGELLWSNVWRRLESPLVSLVGLLLIGFRS